MLFGYYEYSDTQKENNYYNNDTVEVDYHAGHYIKCPLDNSTDQLIITGHYEDNYERNTYVYCKKHSYEFIVT